MRKMHLVGTTLGCVTGVLMVGNFVGACSATTSLNHGPDGGGGTDSSAGDSGGSSSSGSSGGSSSGSSSSSSGSGTDASSDAPAGNPACTAYATTHCSFLGSCEPGSLQESYGTQAQCVQTLETECNNGNLTVPGTGYTTTYLTACTAFESTFVTACANGPVPLPLAPSPNPCSIIGAGAGGAVCGLDEQCASNRCDVPSTSSCGQCVAVGTGALGAACGGTTGVTCELGLDCGDKNVCVSIVAGGATCDFDHTSICTEGSHCVAAAAGAATGTCLPDAVKAGAACSTSDVALPWCNADAGFFCAPLGACTAIVYAASGAACGTSGNTETECAGGNSCLSGICTAPLASGAVCTVGSGASCGYGTLCVTGADGGTAGVCTPKDPTCPAQVMQFQPSNISLPEISKVASQAQDENLSAACTITTSASGSGQGCFNSPMEAVTQEDGSTVNLVVVKSLTMQSGAAITVDGGVPLVIISLGDVTFDGGSISANSSNATDVGPGGTAGAAVYTTGLPAGSGGNAAGSSGTPGGGGGSYCGIGAAGGGTGATASNAFGNDLLRPLIGGAAGGGGWYSGIIPSTYGASGGGLQISAGGTFNLKSGAYITAGGAGGTGGAGAGGGGSGGSILLEAATMTIAGIVAANGGGGGGNDSNNGNDATASGTAAPGGPGGTNTAAGGAGSSAANINGVAGAAAPGADSGGGGGGAGRIRINSGTAATLTGGTISPAIAASGTSCTTMGGLRAIGAGP